MLDRYRNEPELAGDIMFSRDRFVEHFYDYYAPAVSSTVPEVTQPARRSATLEFIGTFGPTRPAVQTPRSELEKFLALQPESFDVCDPIQWWAGHRNEFPILSRFARDVFSIPGILRHYNRYETCLTGS
jgi:hypothetical protein